MRVLFNTFNAGELSPKIAGRTDLPPKACFRLRNFFPRVTGGVFRRPGQKYCWDVLDSAVTPRLMPFNFSASDAILLEFGNLKLRFGQSDALLGSPLEITTPWTASEIFDIRFRQINDVVFLAHENHPPYRLIRNSNTDWELESIHDIIAGQDPDDGFPWPAFRDENPGLTSIAVTGDISNHGGAVTLTASDDVFEDGHEEAFFQIAHRRDTAYDELFIPVFLPASATMDFRVQPIEGQQFTIAGTVYTWKEAANISGAYQVEIGSTIEDSRDNAVSAINGNTTTGGFGSGTAPNADVEATAEELSATNQAATGVLTGNGTNALAEPQADPVNVVVNINGVKYGFMNNPVDALFNGATYNVKRGATEKDSLTNLVKAINASGTNGTEYYGPSGVTAHPDVTAALTADNQVTVTAKTAGTAGNAVTTSVNDSSVATEPLQWGGTTLAGGGGSTSFRLKVSAFETGAEGNDITVGGMVVGVLTSTNVNVSNNDTVTIGSQTYTFKTILTPAADEVLIGVSADASLLNLIRAINLTGTPGTDYGAATTINTSVFAGAAVTAAHEVLLSSKTVNPAASIPTTEAAATLSFGATTLQRQWNSTTLTGGADADTASDGFEVLGEYKIWSYGLWKGTVILEREASDGTWEALRQWRGSNDRNIIEEGTADFPQKLRFRLVNGSGTSSADVDRPRFVVEANDARIYGIVRIVEVTSPTVATGTVVRAVFSTEATRNWSEGAWSDYRGFPRAVAVHNQRLVFMGTDNQPQTMWLSATGDFLNFRRGLNDADALSLTLAGDENSPILWAQSVGSGIVIGKESEEWLGISSDGQASITPTNFQAKRQSAYGSAQVEPIVVGPRVLFVKSGGRELMDYQFAYEEQAFFALSLNELADHLTIGGIKQIAFSRRPEEIVWIVTTDGRLLTMHYRRDKEQIAWAWHQTGAVYESVAAINGTSSVDHVYVAVQRTFGNSQLRFIERVDLATLLECDSEDIDTIAQRSLLNYLDSSVKVTGTFTTSAGGLGHLEGQEVSLQVDGSFHPKRTVVGGTVTLERAASTVLAGFDYADSSYLIPFNIDLASQDGTAQGKKVKAGEMWARVYNTSAFRHKNHFSSPDTERWDAKLDTATDEVNSPTPVANKVVALCQTPRYQDDLRVVIQPTSAEPCNVLSISVALSVSGNP